MDGSYTVLLTLIAELSLPVTMHSIQTDSRVRDACTYRLVTKFIVDSEPSMRLLLSSRLDQWYQEKQVKHSFVCILFRVS